MNLDLLRDIVSHTVSLNLFDTARIRGTKDNTFVDSVGTQSNIKMEGQTLAAEPEFEGVFGMPNLQKLSAILNNPEYKENATIQLIKETKDGKDRTTGIHFENQHGDFKNDYRFMDGALINAKWGDKTFKGATWQLEFAPLVIGISKFKYQAQILKEEMLFTAKIDNNNLCFSLGNPTTYSGDFVFHSNVTGKNKVKLEPLMWPINNILPILDLPGEKMMRFSNEGIMNIEVRSEICVYNYYILSNAK